MLTIRKITAKFSYDLSINLTSKVLATNEAYGPVTNTWTSKVAMPTARQHAASAMVGGIALGPMPSKRSGIAASFLNGSSSFYVFGGEEPSKTFNNEKCVNKWTSETVVPTAGHGLEATVIDGGPQPALSVTNANEILSSLILSHLN